MRIEIAKHAGFCFGVKRAVDTVFSLDPSSGEKITAYGPLIHNESVIERMAEMGIETVDDPDAITQGTVIIRSHGVSPDVEARFKTRGLKVIDTTCPYVKRIHKIVAERAEAGDTLVILGNANHPEVVGIAGWAGERVIIIEGPEALEHGVFDPEVHYSVVVQTTFNQAVYASMIDRLEQKMPHLKLYDTICSATEQRQKSVVALAKRVDLLYVVGGKNSSNTKKLYERAKEHCAHVYLVQNKDDLLVTDFQKYDNIGVAAGASTPDWIIHDIIFKIENEGEVFI